jgi:hypothetical protein
MRRVDALFNAAAERQARVERLVDILKMIAPDKEVIVETVGQTTMIRVIGQYPDQPNNNHRFSVNLTDECVGMVWGASLDYWPADAMRMFPTEQGRFRLKPFRPEEPGEIGRLKQFLDKPLSWFLSEPRRRK